MFYEWLSAGLKFGVEAFAALFIFMMLWLVVLGVAGFVGNIIQMKGSTDDDMDRD